MKKLLGLVSLLLILSSCLMIDPPVLEESYFPLAVGNEWHYYSFDEMGFDSTIKSIDSTTIIDGIEYYVLNSWEPVNDESLDQKLYREENGVVYGYSNSFEEEYLVYDFNKRKGIWWSMSPFKVNARIISKTDSIVTVNGTFSNCITIKTDSRVDRTEMKFIPEIGFVYGNIVFKHAGSIDNGPQTLIWARINGNKIKVY